MTRVRLPERIAGAGALALLVFLFLLDWYGGSIEGLGPGSHISGGTVNATGWEAFTSSRWVWLATIALALGSVLAAAASYRLEGPVQIGAVVFGMGTLSSVLILYRIVHHPGENASGHGLQIAYGIKFGIWLGLLAALAIALGGWLQLLAEARGPAPADEGEGAGAASESTAQERGEDGSDAFSGLTVAERKPPPPGRAG